MEETCLTCVALDPDRREYGKIISYGWCNRFNRKVRVNGRACDGYVRNNQCFLTTACVRHKGLADDCEELTLLRKFRDEYMKKNEAGEALVKQYYDIAPAIVDKIDKRSDKDALYEKIYSYIKECVRLIEAGEFAKTQETYINMVNEVSSEVQG